MSLETIELTNLESGAASISVTSETTENPRRIWSVIYVNTTVHPTYLRVEPPGVAPVRFDLPGNKTATINIPPNQRPLLDTPVSMGFAEPS